MMLYLQRAAAGQSRRPFLFINIFFCVGRHVRSRQGQPETTLGPVYTRQCGPLAHLSARSLPKASLLLYGFQAITLHPFQVSTSISLRQNVMYVLI
jgi:hypothetical protein